MTSLIFIAAFIVCLAMAAAAVLIGHSFIATYNNQFHRHYFYYLVAFYLFGIYGFWGQILGRVLLASLDAGAGTVETVASFLSVMGVPILFVSWLMLINMAYSMFGSILRQGWVPLHAVIFILIILGAWATFSSSPGRAEFLGANLQYVVIGSLVGLEMLYVGTFLLVAYRAGGSVTSETRGRLRQFSWLLAGAFLLRSALLPLAFVRPLGALVVLVYFGSGLIPLFFLRANNDRLFEPVRAESTSAEKMQRIFDQFGVTKRERQIVEEICSGKTNQQIADALFISLQTVKDHTHRIYSKIGVRNRIQLVQTVNDQD